jgi:gliding motility-associated-like protein
LYEIYIATGFTPNNDGINDWLYVQGGTEVVNVKSFNVFDRWGEMVFAASDFAPNDFDIGWNGEFQGQQAPSGVYAWTAEVEFSDGRMVLFKGSTTLLR